MIRLLILFSVCSLLGGNLHASAEDYSNYLLGSGDKISIQVFNEEDLNLEVTLSDAGTISYPFLGEIKVAGQTISQLEEAIVAGLKGDYLVDPKVNISVIGYRQFYMNGEVKSPGGYAFQPGLTLDKAVALAGGFTERASKSKIYVVHDGGKIGKEGAKKAQLSLNDAVNPGDIITVEQSFF